MKIPFIRENSLFLNKKIKTPSKRLSGDIYIYGITNTNPGKGSYAALIVKPNVVTIINNSMRFTTSDRMTLYATIKALGTLNYPYSINLYTTYETLVNALNKNLIYNWEAAEWLYKKTDIPNNDLFQQLTKFHRYHKIDAFLVQENFNDYMKKCKELALASMANKDKKIDEWFERNGCALIRYH